MNRYKIRQHGRAVFCPGAAAGARYFVMALLQVNYVSQALMHQVALNVILPVDEFASESSP